MNIATLVERTQVIRDAFTPDKARQRIACAAQELEQASVHQMRIELLNEALCAFTTGIYTLDSTGRFIHVDVWTYRIMAAKPWATGWRHWGLRQWEGRVLRAILIMRSQMRRLPPVYDYNAGTRQWYLNVSVYPTAQTALGYWKANRITLSDWHKFADLLRQDI